MHSATKYMNGHSDVVMGLLTVKSEELKQKLHFVQYAVGGVPSAFDCYLGTPNFWHLTTVYGLHWRLYK